MPTWASVSARPSPLAACGPALTTRRFGRVLALALARFARASGATMFASVLGWHMYEVTGSQFALGMIGGDIFHGALSLDLLFSARPVLGHGNYRSPVPGLYLCGSGTHPGGGVTGIPGHNAAREILRDVRRKRF